VQADEHAPVFATGEVEVVADRDTVWDGMSEVQRWPEWNSDITAVTLHGPVRPGTTFAWKSGPGTIRSTFQVVDRPSELSWTEGTRPGRAGGTGRRRPSSLRSVSLAVRLLCELGLLVALAVWGFRVGVGIAVKLLLGLGAPLLAAVVWGLWVAPASRRRLGDPARLVVEVRLFGAGVAALVAAGLPLVAVGFAVVVAVNMVLVRML
jgi:hypothetical protein